MSRRNLVGLFWKLRPYYRIIVDDAGRAVRWDPRGRCAGGRKLTFAEFCAMVRRFQLRGLST